MAVQLLPGPFTVADYYRMAEAGILRPDARVELLDGQVVPKVTIGPRHAACVTRLDHLLQRVAGGSAHIRAQNPVRLGDRSEPEPDLALLKPRVDGYRTAHPVPKDTFLVIEVADTTLDFDLEVKVPLYARAGIPEVWVIDLGAERIQVFREPVAGAYVYAREVSRGSALSPLRLPQLSVEVDEVLG